MTLLRQLASELYSMFAGDATMSAFAITIVAAVAAVRFLTPLPSFVAGIGLLIGCLALLVIRVLAHARNTGR